MMIRFATLNCIVKIRWTEVAFVSMSMGQSARDMGRRVDCSVRSSSLGDCSGIDDKDVIN